MMSFKFVLHIGDFTYPRLADFGAAICGANRHQTQEVLEELDVSSFNITATVWYSMLGQSLISFILDPGS